MTKALIAAFISMFLSYSTQDIVKVSIYYEALCPDSADFITKQLAPNYNKISDYINVDFVPYGKANHTLNNDGVWQFFCHNWEDECYGNKMQACALSLTEDQATRVEFISCVMGSYYPAGDYYMEQCAVLSGVSWEDMVECVKSGEASELLAEYGDQTHAVEPAITFVPTIIYNDVYDEDLQASSLTDFLSTFCSIIDDDVCA